MLRVDGNLVVWRVGNFEDAVYSDDSEKYDAIMLWPLMVAVSKGVGEYRNQAISLISYFFNTSEDIVKGLLDNQLIGRCWDVCCFGDVFDDVLKELRKLKRGEGE